MEEIETQTVGDPVEGSCCKERQRNETMAFKERAKEFAFFFFFKGGRYLSIFACSCREGETVIY